MKFAAKSLPLLPRLLGAGLGLAILLCYWPVFIKLAYRFAVDEDYSFGLLLPLVSAYIIYLKWPQIRRQPVQPSWTGLAVIALGLMLYILGSLAMDVYIPAISFLVVLSGILVLLAGWAMVRLLMFPLLLLFFMMPLPGLFLKQITFPLQLLSTRLAAEVLQALGYPLVRHGNVIDLGMRQLQVVDACSGLRYILSLLALAIIYCYFYQRQIWKAAFLILAVIPAAIIANVWRITGMGIFPTLQTGFWHGFSGWLIFIFYFGFFALLNLGLNYLQPPTEKIISTHAHPVITPSKTCKTVSTIPYLIAALVLMMIGGPLALKMGRAAPTPLQHRLHDFPLSLGPWRGQHLTIDPDMLKRLRTSDCLDAQYYHPEYGSISLWIAFYETQKKGEGGVHSPLHCLPGGGWQTLQSRVFEVAPGLAVNYLVMEEAGKRIGVYYWYIQGGRWLANEYFRKLYMGFDGLFSRRNDCALIRLISPMPTDEESARNKLTSFTLLLVQVLPQFMQMSVK